MQEKIIYVAIDLYQKGGIQRYSRAQIEALIEIYGEENVIVLSLYSSADAVQTFDISPKFPIEILKNKSRYKFINRILYSLKAAVIVLHEHPTSLWVNHVKLFPLAKFLQKMSRGSIVIGNVYGLEIWSGLKPIELWALRNMYQVIADCHFTKKYICSHLQVKEENVEVIWDPVDTSKFMSKDTVKKILPRYGVPYKADNRYLMTIGRISKASLHKGYDRIIDVMRLIDQDNILYLIGGDGDERERLIERTKNEGLGERVYFLGNIPEAELVDIYNACDVFILVSDQGVGRGEGVPLTPLEAAACGKPIIVGNADGSIEAVNNEENGFVVNPNDLDAIKNAILCLANDNLLRQQMGEAARENIERNFSYYIFKQRHQLLVDRWQKE